MDVSISSRDLLREENEIELEPKMRLWKEPCTAYRMTEYDSTGLGYDMG